MSDKIICYDLPIDSWHRIARAVFDVQGISEIIPAQSNNHVRKVIVYERIKQQPIKFILGYSRDERGKVLNRHINPISGSIHCSEQGGNTAQFVLCVWRIDTPSGTSTRMGGGNRVKPTAAALRATDYKRPPCAWILCRLRSEQGKRLRKKGIDTFSGKEYALRQDNVSNTITSIQKDNYVFMAKCDYKEIDWSRVREVHGDTFTLDDGTQFRCRVRKLTPRECFRLMDVSDADIDKIEAAGISKSQQYKMAGNSIVVSCLYHIFKQMFHPDPVTPKRGQQLSLFGND